VDKDNIVPSAAAYGTRYFICDCGQIEEINLKVESCLRRSVSGKFISVKHTSDNKVISILTIDVIAAAFTEDGIMASPTCKGLTCCAAKNDVIASTASKIATFKVDGSTDGGKHGIRDNGRGAAAAIAAAAIAATGVGGGDRITAAAIAATGIGGGDRITAATIAATGIGGGGITAATATGVDGVAYIGTTAAKTCCSAAPVSVSTSGKNKT
jgi:hypothetical protein